MEKVDWTSIIDSVSMMIEKEESHLKYLKKERGELNVWNKRKTCTSIFSRSPIILNIDEFIRKSESSLDHLKQRKKEYIQYMERESNISQDQLAI
jgi:hypothetical protein